MDLVICINMIHITPWKCTTGLLKGCGTVLKEGSFLLTYGPYSIDGVITPMTNIMFHKVLYNMNKEFGIRCMNVI